VVFVARHPAKQKSCAFCGKHFTAKQVIDGKMRSLYRRRFCLDCSPFGVHNSSEVPPGNLDAADLIQHRLRRRRAKSYRSQKKRRREKKSKLVQASGGRCVNCGYAGAAAALDFHHRDGSTKEFSISTFSGSWAQLVGESKKCDLLCANCHRVGHAIDDANAEGGAVTEQRRRTKARAVDYLGGTCFGCGREGPPGIFDFHHRDPGEKEFGIGQNGVPRRWESVVAELAKCVMLCANCHREIHAGVRFVDDGLLGLAEARGLYVAA
jgi:ribosomal protein L44E